MKSMDADDKRALKIKLVVFAVLFFLLFVFGVRYDAESGTKRLPVTDNSFSEEYAAPARRTYEFDLHYVGTAEKEEDCTIWLCGVQFRTSMKPGDTQHFKVVAMNSAGRENFYNYLTLGFSEYKGLEAIEYDETSKDRLHVQDRVSISDSDYHIENVTVKKGGWIISVVGFVLGFLVLIIMSLVFVPMLEGMAVHTDSRGGAFSMLLLLTLADIGVIMVLALLDVPVFLTLIRSFPKGTALLAALREQRLFSLIIGAVCIIAAACCLYRKNDGSMNRFRKAKKAGFAKISVLTILQMLVHMVWIACMVIWALLLIAVIKVILSLLVFFVFGIALCGASIGKISDDDFILSAVFYKLLGG